VTKIDPNIFREYDIRGMVGGQLTAGTVSVIGRAIGTYLQQNGARRIAVGYDARESSPEFRELIVEGLNRSGCNAVLIGMVPTPALYHTVYTANVDGGVMITGSHNPADHNGFRPANSGNKGHRPFRKICRRHGLIRNHLSFTTIPRRPRHTD
jgi:phosphomannomutase